jgi:SAM-dependent methyltransferase
MADAPAPAAAQWTARFFDETFWAFAADVYTEQQTEREVAFLLDVTGARAGWSCLDLGCGRGRHAVALAERGLAVTGVDVNADSIAHARALAAEREQSVALHVADMRTFPIEPGSYDLVVVLQNTFGFFSDVENAALLRRARVGVRPGGSVYVDAANFDYLRDRLEPREEVCRGGRRYVLEQQYDYPSASMTQRLASLEPGAAPPKVAVLRMYGAAELATLLRLAGAVGVRVYGSFDSTRPARPDDRYVQVVGRAPPADS